ncbi:DUF1496 domain-containing protein [Arsukibacterium perlucidum]|uniref:DUF1496 domain-containing protein n=1 Tax=Arsukibacterium perlucidum TaxID=368811 RepID=UPI000A078511|nr:DUF1496 domain-containing protein [Arsukibacterium perlucidum]
MNKKFLITLAFLSVSVSSYAENTSSEKVENVDFTKYCYFEGKSFSEGSRHKQSGQIVQCIRDEKGDLNWVKA